MKGPLFDYASHEEGSNIHMMKMRSDFAAVAAVARGYTFVRGETNRSETTRSHDQNGERRGQKSVQFPVKGNYLVLRKYESTRLKYHTQEFPLHHKKLSHLTAPVLCLRAVWGVGGVRDKRWSETGRAFPIADQQRRVVSTHDGASPEPLERLRAPSCAPTRALSVARSHEWFPASRSAGPRASGFPVHLGPALTPPLPRSPPLQVVLAASVVTKGGKGAPRHPNPTRAAPRVPPRPRSPARHSREINP